MHLTHASYKTCAAAVPLFFLLLQCIHSLLYTFVAQNVRAMGIRTKIMLGFMILGSMLFISGAISIFELTKLGRSVKGLIHDNYRSIDYSRSMLDALEQQENALLLFANGDSAAAVTKFYKAHQTIMSSLDSAYNNLNLKDEVSFVDSVKHHYSIFKSLAEDAFKEPDFSLNNYLTNLSTYTVTTTEHVKNLITINQQGLFNSAAFLETSAQRASMPGLIVIITSLIFTFVFTYLIHHYFVEPILRLTKGINDYVKYRKPFDVILETKDEFHSLKESIVSLISLQRAGSKKQD